MITTNIEAQRAAAKQMALGRAISTVGVGMAAVGAIGAKWLDSAVNQAKTFQNQVALVRTQVDNVNVSQKQLENVSKNVAKNIAVPLDQLNSGLYDIFSSMDVNVPQAATLLSDFAKEAVAGQVDLQTAGRATIAILNAFHLPVTDATKVLDVQFELVKKGVGTFQEFAESIGQAIPSAQRAGQSIETLAGMMAYLTRNGLSTSMAAASAQRALDAFSNPKVVERLKGMGIAILNNKGGFNDLGTVMDQLQGKLSKMTDPQRSAALQQLFLGAGGTIQARRFFDTVLESKQSVDQFLGLTKDMDTASGTLNSAYATMSNTVASKTQVLTNQFDIMKISVGQALLPALSAVISVASKLVGWWNSLSSSTQKTIVYIVAAASGLFIVGGIILFVVGTFIMMAGAAAMADIALAPMLLTVLGVVLGIALLAAGAVLLIQHWGAVSSAIKAVWVPVVHALGDAWNWLWNKILKPVMTWIDSQIGGPMDSMWKSIEDNVGAAMSAIDGAVHKVIGSVSQFIHEMWGNIDDWTHQHWSAIQGTIKFFTDWFAAVWPYLRGIISNVLYIIVTIMRNTWDMIAGIIKATWDTIVGVVEGAWEIIASVFRGSIDIIEGVVGLFIDLLTGKWNKLGGDLLKIITGVWEIIRGVFAGAFMIIIALFEGFGRIIGSIATALWRDVVALFKGGVGIVGNIWDTFVGSMQSIWNRVWANITSGFDSIMKGLKSRMGTLVAGLKGIWHDIEGAFAAPVNFVIDTVWNHGIVALWNDMMRSLGINAMLPQFNDITGYAGGGPVNGPGTGTSDSILAWLSNKEFVVNAKSTAQWLPWLHAINKGMMPGFAAGGQVNTATVPAVQQLIAYAQPTADVAKNFGQPYTTVKGAGQGGNWLEGTAISALTMVNKTAAFIMGKVADFLSSVPGAIFGGGSSPKGPTPAQSAMYQYAGSLFPHYGWNARMLASLVKLWIKESNWNPFAINKSSGAYGIPQSLGHGHPYNLGDWRAQIAWGENYIAGRYGNPDAAWAHEMSHNWYDRGGFVPRGFSTVMNGTSGNEHMGILTGPQWQVLNQLANPRNMMSGNTGNTYNITVEGINIYTQEIDPAVHAAELGDYLTRMGAGATIG